MTQSAERFGTFILAACLLFGCACQSARAQAGRSPAAPSPAGQASPADASSSKSSPQTSAMWETAADGQSLVVSGTLRLVGNEPFTRLVITDAAGRDWIIDAAGRKALAGHETKPVRVSAILRLKPQILANGKRLPDLRELTRVKLLK
jgi:hypothetical protein